MKFTIRKMVMKFPGEKSALLITAHRSTITSRDISMYELVGTVVVRDFEPGGCAEFSRLFVSEQCRRKGIGHALMKAVTEAAKAGKATGISGYVNHTNINALAFYKGEKFMPVYRFPDGDHLVWRPL